MSSIRQETDKKVKEMETVIHRKILCSLILLLLWNPLWSQQEAPFRFGHSLIPRKTLESLINDYTSELKEYGRLTENEYGNRFIVIVDIKEINSVDAVFVMRVITEFASLMHYRKQVIGAFEVDTIGVVVIARQLEGVTGYPSIEFHSLMKKRWPGLYPHPYAPPPDNYPGTYEEWSEGRVFLARLGASIRWEITMNKGKLKKMRVFNDYVQAEKMQNRSAFSRKVRSRARRIDFINRWLFSSEPRPQEVIRYRRNKEYHVQS